ncbi:hypothetical protein LDK45_08230, partial [Lactiplantibacillus plantarum]|nr:hypothetical protein [Lactiplantibacillus plantarum]
HSWGMPPVMFSVVTKYHKGRHSLFLYNSEIFYAFTQDILRSLNPDDQYILLVIYVMKLATFTSFAIAFVDSLGPIKEIQQLIVGAQSSDTLDSDKKVLTVTIFKKIRWMLILYQVLKVPALIILLNLSVDY